MALYCQDEKADVGPVARVRHTAATGEVMPQTHTYTHLTTQTFRNTHLRFLKVFETHKRDTLYTPHYGAT